MIERWVVDNPPSRRYPIYTRANVGEVFPEPVAPLTGTIGINENAEPGWRDSWERFGVFDRSEFDPDNNEVIGVFRPGRPLFVPASAVIVDVGAPLSHAIIVSRELGIPCVVSVTDGTKRIPDGALVEVDGDTGSVTVLEV